MNFKLELVTIPVTNVDRAKAFYEQAGFVLDHDHVVSNDVRFVQFTPPGSACSIALGTGLTDAPVGSARLQVVVDDAEAACQELGRRGVGAGEGKGVPVGSVTLSADPDGNRWSVQQVPPRNRS